MLCDSRAGILLHRIPSARPRNGFIAEPSVQHILAQCPAKSQGNGPQEMHGKVVANKSGKNVVDDERVERYIEEHPYDGVAGKPFGTLVERAKAAGDFDLPRDRINFYRTTEAGLWGVNASRILRVDGTSVEDLTRAEMEGRRQVLALLRFLRKYIPGCENASIATVAPQVGIRESRRIVGEHVLTLEDLQTGREFPDVIALYNYPVDIHSATDGTGGIQGHIPIAPIYQIPYRSLVPLGVEQLPVAGRCLSATHEAAAAVRVMPACFAMGQAAGTAAALSAKGGVPPRHLDVALLQRRLLEQGAYLGPQSALTGDCTSSCVHPPWLVVQSLPTETSSGSQPCVT